MSMKLEQMMENEEFNAKMVACENQDQVNALLKEYDVELPSTDADELTEDQLENVAGGIAWGTILTCLAALAWVIENWDNIKTFASDVWGALQSVYKSAKRGKKAKLSGSMIKKLRGAGCKVF